MSVHENNNTRHPEAITASPSALQQACSINISKEGRFMKRSLLIVGMIEVMLGVFNYSCLEPPKAKALLCKQLEPHIII